MKKGILTSIGAILAFALISCSDTSEQKPAKPITRKEVHTSDVRGVRGTNNNHSLRSEKPRSIEIGEENFKKIAGYIQKHGFVVAMGPKGVLCGRQYTFFDKVGNRHAMIACKTDAGGQPSVTGTVTFISVWGYYKGIKDQDHFFVYQITKEKAYLFTSDDAYVKKHISAVEKGYNDFLAFVDK